MRVVATDRTIVAARIAAMAHGGKCAGTAAGGESGGTGEREGAGGEGVAHAGGAGPMAAVGQTASPPSLASALGMRGGRAGAGWWLIEWFLRLPGRTFLSTAWCVVRTDTAARDSRNCIGIGLEQGGSGDEMVKAAGPGG
jgi:hypothetical protein